MKDLYYLLCNRFAEHDRTNCWNVGYFPQISADLNALCNFTAQSNAKWGIVGWGEKSEVMIVPFAPASIRVEYFRYPDFISHQYKSRPAALKSVELLWIYGLAAAIGIGLSGNAGGNCVTCPAQYFSLQNLLSLLLQPSLCIWNGEVSLVLGFEYFFQFVGLGHRTQFTDTWSVWSIVSHSLNAKIVTLKYKNQLSAINLLYFIAGNDNHSQPYYLCV